MRTVKKTLKVYSVCEDCFLAVVYQDYPVDGTDRQRVTDGIARLDLPLYSWPGRRDKDGYRCECCGCYMPSSCLSIFKLVKEDQNAE